MAVLLTSKMDSGIIKTIGRIYQYSFGTKVRINGNFEEGVKIEFSLEQNKGKAIVSETIRTEEYIESMIPYELLGLNENVCSCFETDYMVYVFVTKEQEDVIETLEKLKVEVELRPEPEFFVIKEQVLTWMQLEKRIEKLEKTSGSIIDDTLSEESENPVQNKVVTKELKNKLSKETLTEATNEILQQAKESGEFDGTNGTTPHIGENGNWFIGETDTGVKAQGSDASVTSESIKEALGYTPADEKVVNEIKQEIGNSVALLANI